MITFNQTFEESRAIRVLVVPIGENCMYDKHFETVSRRRSLPLFDLNKPSDWKNQNSPFKNFDWQSSGNIKFEYLRYDRVAHGPSDLDNFQASRRVLVIIGVINYPELDESVSSKLEVEMEYYSRRYPSIILRRYFVFNYFEAKEGSPLLELTEKTTALDPYAMVIFPPDRECEGGSMIDVHTKEIMENVAVKLFAALEFHLLKCDEYRQKAVQHVSSYKSNPQVTAASLLPSWLSLSTSYDTVEYADTDAGLSTGPTISFSMSGSQTERNKKTKKRINGRMKKWMGDVCLQVCSPFDALEYYSSAMSECRSHHDYVWLASALEGTVVAMLAVMEQEKYAASTLPVGSSVESVGSDGRVIQSFNYMDQLPHYVKELKSHLSNGQVTRSAVLRVAELRCVEAMEHYSKTIVMCGLEVECALKCARMHEDHNADNVLDTTAFSSSSKADVLDGCGRREKTVEFILRALAVPGLNVQQQIECTLEGAFACYRLGMPRKYAFLLYVAASLSANAENTSVAQSLIEKACQQYGAVLMSSSSRINSENGSDINLQDVNRSFTIVEAPNSSWSSMRRVLFAQCAHIATQNCDEIAAAHALATLLRLAGEMEVNRYVIKRFWSQFEEGNEECEADEQSRKEMSRSDRRSTIDSHSLLDSPLLNSLTPSPARSKHSSWSSRTGSSRPVSLASFSKPGDHGSVASSLWSKRHSIQLTNALMSSKNNREGDFDAPSNDSSQQTPDNVETPDKFPISNSGDRDNEDLENSKDMDVESINDDDECEDLSCEDGSGSQNDSNEARGLISIPKIAPFVQNMVSIGGNLKKKSRGKEKDDVNSDSGGASGGMMMTLDQSVSNAAGFITNMKSHVLQRNGRMPSRPLTDDAYQRAPNLRRHNSTSSSSTSQPHSQYRPGSSGTNVPSSSAEITSVEPDINKGVTMEKNYLNNFEDASSRLSVPPEVQKQLMKVFMSLCGQVPPATPLLLEGLPFLLQLKPLPLHVDHSPVKLNICNGVNLTQTEPTVDAEGPTKPSALFYDPFAAKRRKAQGLSTTMEILWSVNSLCYVEAQFTNPLAIPIVLQDLRVLLDEGSVPSANVATSYALYNVVVPPFTAEFTVTLAIRPRMSCTLKLKGIQYNLFNALHSALVDVDTGQGVVSLKKELSPPAQYPYRKINDDLKLPPQFASSTSREGGACVEAARESTIKTRSTERIRHVCITVVPESALLRLAESWASSSPPTATMDNSMSSSNKQMHNFNSVNKPSKSSLCKGLSNLDLFQGEKRIEKITLTNISKSLKIEDIRVSVRYSLLNGNNDRMKNWSLQLLPFTYLKPQDGENGKLSSDAVACHELLSIKVVIDSDEKPLLPLFPLSSKSISLEFSICNNALQKSKDVHVEFEVNVEYATEFDGWEETIAADESRELRNQPANGCKFTHVRRATMISYVTLSSALSFAAVRSIASPPLTSNCPVTLELAGAFAGLGTHGVELSSRPTSRRVSRSQSLVVEIIRREEAFASHGSRSEMGQQVKNEADGLSESSPRPTTPQKCSRNLSVDFGDTDTNSFCDDFNVINSRRFFAIEVRNELNTPMKVTWCGDNTFTFHSTATNLGESAEFALPPQSSVNVLFSLDDKELCKIIADLSGSNETCGDIHGERVKRTTFSAFEDILQKAYCLLFKKAQFTWKFLNSMEDSNEDTVVRSGHVKYDADEMLSVLRKSSQHWKNMIPHPFELHVSIDNSVEDCLSSQTVISTRHFHKLRVGVHVQPNLLESFSKIFSHIEIMIVIVKESLVKRRCDDFSDDGTAYLPSIEPVSLEKMHLSPFPLQQNGIVVNGRCRKKILLPDCENVPLEHCLDFCCTRNGVYIIQVLARLVYTSVNKRKEDGILPSAPNYSSSQWWTTQSPLVCAAKSSQ